jgi:hypothetical protein
MKQDADKVSATREYGAQACVVERGISEITDEQGMVVYGI